MHEEEQTKTSVILEAYKVKIKVTLVQTLRLCTGRTAHRGSRGVALLYRQRLCTGCTAHGGSRGIALLYRH
jgi:hypothetical protein